MSRVDVRAEVMVYEKDDGDWGRPDDEVIVVETYWNDSGGDYATIKIGGHSYTIVAKDLRLALEAVTRR